jgi:hypothetical protein
VLSPAPLVPPPNDELDVLIEHARSFVDAAHAPNTRRGSFVAWCGAMRLRPLPASADTVALYVAALDREGLVHASVNVALTAIASSDLRTPRPRLDHVKHDHDQGGVDVPPLGRPDPSP